MCRARREECFGNQDSGGEMRGYQECISMSAARIAQGASANIPGTDTVVKLRVQLVTIVGVLAGGGIRDHETTAASQEIRTFPGASVRFLV
jgi:hypothetical protein